ncbi:MAG TPA: hypothetical protein VK169_08790 [Saprospiraceae bacterium]|nr:hypothetical protein [Saprospiraceae bacterium]
MFTRLFLFILSTGSIYYFFYNNTQEITKTFEPNQILNIRLVESKVIDKNGIGNEWVYHASTNEQQLINGEIYHFELNGKSEFELISKAIEQDNSHDDVGSFKTQITPENLFEFVHQKTLKVNVNVHEIYGSGAGNTANCEFTYEITLDTLPLL